jgi:uncharacterized protein YbaR (Trm112 family)
MALEFPTQLISKVCCTNDGATLELGKNCQLSEDGGFVRHGTLRCCHCNTNFAIDDGILKMLNDIALDNQSKREQQLRNENAFRSIQIIRQAWDENAHHSMEMIPTLEAMSLRYDYRWPLCPAFLSVSRLPTTYVSLFCAPLSGQFEPIYMRSLIQDNIMYITNKIGNL